MTMPEPPRDRYARLAQAFLGRPNATQEGKGFGAERFRRDIADCVLFMEQGRIGAQGTPSYIFQERPTQSLRDFLEPK